MNEKLVKLSISLIDLYLNQDVTDYERYILDVLDKIYCIYEDMGLNYKGSLDYKIKITHEAYEGLCYFFNLEQTKDKLLLISRSILKCAYGDKGMIDGLIGIVSYELINLANYYDIKL